MKPKLSQKHTEPTWPGKSVKRSEKPSVRQTSARVRPFTGKVFYLDLQSNRTAETLEKDIKELGGTVEKFFSKEIRYLVSNKREAKYAACFRQDSPVPSPVSGPSSPHPHSRLQHVDIIRNASQDQADTLVKSRGQSLVERVVKEQGRIQMDRILSKALEWGVKILYIDDVLAYVQRKRKHFNSQVKASVKTESSANQHWQKRKAGRIRKPFVKVEDSSRHYCPIYLTMSNMPKFNLKAAAPCCPFCHEEKVPSGSKHQAHRGLKASVNEEKVQGLKKSRDKKRGGYCECCTMKYNNLQMHLQSERHKAFSKTEEYSVVDKLVSTLHFSFIPIKTKVKSRAKSNISSVVPGSCGGGAAVGDRGGGGSAVGDRGGGGSAVDHRGGGGSAVDHRGGGGGGGSAVDHRGGGGSAVDHRGGGGSAVDHRRGGGSAVDHRGGGGSAVDHRGGGGGGGSAVDHRGGGGSAVDHRGGGGGGGSAVDHRGGGGAVGDSENIKVQERWAGQLQNSRSVIHEASHSSTSQLHSKRNRWNCSTYSNRSKHKSLLWKSNTLIFSGDKSEQVQILQVKSETPGEAEIHERDTNCSMSCLQTTHPESEASHDDDVKKNQALQDFQTETGENLYSDFFTFRRIHRRVRVDKQKRRKIDLNVERSESGESPDDVVLKLQELFQSSEDQHVEFYGFTE